MHIFKELIDRTCIVTVSITDTEKSAHAGKVTYLRYLLNLKMISECCYQCIVLITIQSLKFRKTSQSFLTLRQKKLHVVLRNMGQCQKRSSSITPAANHKHLQ